MGFRGKELPREKREGSSGSVPWSFFAPQPHRNACYADYLQKEVKEKTREKTLARFLLKKDEILEQENRYTKTVSRALSMQTTFQTSFPWFSMFSRNRLPWRSCWVVCLRCFNPLERSHVFYFPFSAHWNGLASHETWKIFLSSYFHYILIPWRYVPCKWVLRY